MSVRSIHRSRAITCSLFLALYCLPWLVSQTDPALEAGLKPFGSYHGSDIDFVSTTTGRLHVHIPLFSVPQLGGRLHADYFIAFDSAAYSLCVLHLPSLALTSKTKLCLGRRSAHGSKVTLSLPLSKRMFLTTLRKILSMLAPFSMSTIQMELAIRWELFQLPQGPHCTCGRWTRLDTTWSTSNFLSPTVYDADGNNYNTSTGVIQDAIGNSMTLSAGAITSDTVHRSIPAPPTNGTTCPNWTPWQVPGNKQNGGTVTYQLCFTSVGLLQMAQFAVSDSIAEWDLLHLPLSSDHNWRVSGRHRRPD